MATLPVFALKKRDRRGGCDGPGAPCEPNQLGGLSKFFREYAPVSAHFEGAAKPCKNRKSAVAVDPSFKLGRFGPWIGVEHEVADQSEACRCKAIPKRFGFGAQKQVVIERGRLVFGEPVGRLVYTHDQSIGVPRGQQCGAHSGPAEGIEYERPWIAVTPIQ